jgi:hypothetical protein
VFRAAWGGGTVRRLSQSPETFRGLLTMYETTGLAFISERAVLEDVLGRRGVTLVQIIPGNRRPRTPDLLVTSARGGTRRVEIRSVTGGPGGVEARHLRSAIYEKLRDPSQFTSVIPTHPRVRPGGTLAIVFPEGAPPVQMLQDAVAHYRDYLVRPWVPDNGWDFCDAIEFRTPDGRIVRFGPSNGWTTPL